jgi:ABC-2 type transport system ATP-binding protein
MARKPDSSRIHVNEKLNRERKAYFDFDITRWTRSLEVVMTLHSNASPIEQATSLSTGSDLVIQTHSLSKHFGPRKAVDALTMSIPSGTIAGFIGPNGAGKTTTIRMLLGLLRPTSGGATILGKQISHPRTYLTRVGALIESPSFYPSLSGRKNLEVIARLGDYPRSRIDQVLEIVGLVNRTKDAVRKYSLGMKQRLGLAMVLLPDPELLILDEPTNGLDPFGIIEMRDLLRGMRDQGKTILVSSHLLGELEKVSDWLVILHEGKTLFNGSANALVERERELVVEATGAAQRDLVVGIARTAGYRVTLRNDSLRIACPADWASELKLRAQDAGAPDITISRREASLEESVLAMLKGGH